MNTSFVTIKPTGEMVEIANIPLSSEHPMPGDTMMFEVTDGVMIFKVDRREWSIRPNPDGGGVNLKFAVVLLQVATMPKEEKNGEEVNKE